VREEGEKGEAGPCGTDGPEAEVGPVACACTSENKEKGSGSLQAAGPQTGPRKEERESWGFRVFFSFFQNLFKLIFKLLKLFKPSKV
jgi:hypothetical protein